MIKNLALEKLHKQIILKEYVAVQILEKYFLCIKYCHPNLKNEDPTLLKITTKDDETRELKYRTERDDNDKILKSLKVDNDYDRKKYETLDKIFFISETLFG